MINLADIYVTRRARLREALAILDRTGIGLLLLTGDDGRFERTVTDGDLRRLILSGSTLDEALERLPRIQSVVLRGSYTRREALELMNHKGINHVPVLADDGTIVKVLERRDIDGQILLSTPHMGDAERDFVDEAFRTNWIAPLGPNVDAFETELARRVGIGHAAAVSSGTAAIHLALILLGVKRGDVVFCSSLTFAASANPIVYLGAEPVFIDSEPTSWNMSPHALAEALKSSEQLGQLPKAVIVVNLYGQSADMDELLALCNRYEVPVVEDAAESLGARYKGRASGTFGRLGIYSFNGNKIITTSGGGMLVSDDRKLIEKARFLSTQARDPAPHYEHSEIGYNYRMSNILAGVGRGQLGVLDERVVARRAVNERYRTGLADVPGLEWMPEPEWSYSTRWLSACVLRPESGTTSAELIKALSAEMIEARPIWKPMHRQPVFAGKRFYSHSAGAAVADRLFEQGLCLPSGSNLTVTDMDRIIAELRRALVPRQMRSHAR